MISISFLKSKLNREDTIKKINASNADFLHIDVMDGLFVPNTHLNIEEIQKVLDLSNKKNDLHLMVNDPLSYLKKLDDYKIEYITVHGEINNMELIDYIKSSGRKAGIAINPDTNINLIISLLKDVDLVLLMSVEPGLGGQKFIDISAKLKELKNIRENYNYHFLIEVDGGINDETVKYVKDADILVSGSYICLSDNYNEKINNLSKGG